jgi:glyoxylase-like metal-dependent hydrolase (beta-lactamase superfamily II)
MSRRYRFGKSNDSDKVQPQVQEGQEGQQAAPATSEQRAPDGSVVTLHLGGSNPFKCFNSYLITGTKHVLVDPGPPGTAGELLQQLSRNHISLGDIGLIVITHGHPDHFGSAAQLKEWTQAPLAVHELDAEYVNFGSVPVLKPVTRLGAIFKSRFPIKSEPVEPDIILHDGDKLGRYAGRGRVILTPGHTAGSISILLPDGTCIVGDLVMRGLRSTTPTATWYAEDAAEARDSLQKLVNAGARTLLAGHGGPFDVEDLARTFPWLEVAEGDATAEAEERVERVERGIGDVGRAGEGRVAGSSEAGGERPRRRRPRHRRPQGFNGPSGGQPGAGTGN